MKVKPHLNVFHAIQTTKQTRPILELLGLTWDPFWTLSTLNH